MISDQESAKSSAIKMILTPPAGGFEQMAPFDKPRAMGYFWQVDKLSADSGGLDLSFLNGTKCEELFGKQMKPGVGYALKYTFPTLKLASQKSVFSPVKEFTLSTGEAIGEWWESTSKELVSSSREAREPVTFGISGNRLF